MEKIERNIFVLTDINAVQPPIEYVQGTNALPIVFHFCDWDIPSGAIMRVYIKKPSGKAEYDSISFSSGNDITIDVKDTMFSEIGRSYIQTEIKDGEKTLVTFEYPVDVKRNNVAGEVPESGNNSNFLDDYLGKIDTRMDAVERLADEALSAASEATNAASDAGKSANDALDSANMANDFAKEAESFAHGGTGTRGENEDVDNAKYYYQQVKQISGGLAGGLIPMGTVSYADLKNQTKQSGYMYNISNDFVTDDTFKDGSGYKYPAGTNVYYTADGYWDCLAGTITPEGIGALAVDGDSAENKVTFTSDDSTEPTGWTDVAQMESGEKHSSLFSKISAMFKNIRWLYKMLGTTDISAIGDGTCTGALSTLNTNLADAFTYNQFLSGTLKTNNPNIRTPIWKYTAAKNEIVSVSANISNQTSGDIFAVSISAKGHLLSNAQTHVEQTWNVLNVSISVYMNAGESITVNATSVNNVDLIYEISSNVQGEMVI